MIRTWTWIIGTLLFVNAACVHVDSPFVFSEDDRKPATIKVKLVEGLDGTLVEVKGAYQVYDMNRKKVLSSGGKGKRFFMMPHKEGIKWGEDYLGYFQLQIIPTSPKTTIYVGGVQYKGCVEFYNIENELTIINEVDIENYLKSTLTHRLSDKIEDVVMDALAIIARTDAYYTALWSGDSFWHVDAKDVGYTGYGLTLLKINIDKAVDNTRYLIMTYEQKPFASTWTENCAGKTASFATIFRKSIESPLGIHSPLAAKDRKENFWTFTIPTKDLAHIAKTNRLTDIELFIDKDSRKVYGIRIKDGAHAQDMNFFDLQKALGRKKLLSNDFTVQIKGNRAIFEGYGKGCGVGLCIYSALQMASRGDAAPKILGFFYPHSRLEKMRSYPDMISFVDSRK